MAHPARKLAGEKLLEKEGQEYTAFALTVSRER
jgi:hypothetical protein